MNLKDPLRSQDFGASDLLREDPAFFSGSAPFFPYCQFSCGKNRRRDEAAAGLLAVLQSRLSISLLSRLAVSRAAAPS